MDKKYSIIWNSFSVDTPLAKRFGITDDEVYLPHFLEGDELIKMENNQDVTIDDLQLAKGILMGWNTTKASLVLPVNDFKPTFITIMNKLKSAFGFEDMEIFIGNLIQLIRDEIGDNAAYTALKGALGILPDNSRVKSDLIINSWRILKTDDSPDQTSLFKDIIKYYEEINFNDIFPHLVEMLDYMYLASLDQSGKLQLKERFYEDVAVNRITHELLKEKVEVLMNIEDVEFEDLKVLTIENES